MSAEQLRFYFECRICFIRALYAPYGAVAGGAPLVSLWLLNRAADLLLLDRES